MFLSKAFSMSEMDILQILKLNYCKKHKSGGEMMLVEMVLILTCIEAQKIQ